MQIIFKMWIIFALVRPKIKWLDHSHYPESTALKNARWFYQYTVDPHHSQSPYLRLLLLTIIYLWPQINTLSVSTAIHGHAQGSKEPELSFRGLGSGPFPLFCAAYGGPQAGWWMPSRLLRARRPWRSSTACIGWTSSRSESQCCGLWAQH